MSDHERGAYTPPTDAPLTFDARQPVRGDRPAPFTLILSILVLAALVGAIAWFYHQGVRHAGQPPRTVGAPLADIKAPPPAEAQPQDPAAGLQIYKTEGGKAPLGSAPQFTPPPEEPEARTVLAPAPPQLVLSPATPGTTAQQPAVAPSLRPSISAQSPTPPKPSPPAKPVQMAKVEPPPAPKPTPKTEAAAPKAAAEPPAKKAAPVDAKSAAMKPPAPAAGVSGAAAVQIGAFSSQALADKGWSDAAAIAPGAAAGKGKSVEKVDKDGKTLFRTQVTGFSSRAEAAAFCDKLKAAGKACFIK